MPYPLNQQNGNPDRRYHVAMEWTGRENGPHPVLRFCDDFIASFNNYNAAAYAAYRHDAKRMGVGRPKNLINYR